MDCWGFGEKEADSYLKIFKKALSNPNIYKILNNNVREGLADDIFKYEFLSKLVSLKVPGKYFRDKKMRVSINLLLYNLKKLCLSRSNTQL